MKDIQYFQEKYPIFYIKNIQYFQEMNKIFSKSLD